MVDDQIINKEYHALQRNKLFKDEDKYILGVLGENIANSLENINFSIKNCLEIGISTKKIQNFILSKYPKVEYLYADLSEKLLNNNFKNKKIYLDHDQWNIDKNKFDIIVSNFYIHLTNNFDLLIKNIHESLTNNGFLICTLPTNKTFYELKECMIKADLEIYGGAYQRFVSGLNIEKISNILKKNNYKIPVISKDITEIRYTKFSSMLKDIRYLGSSNIYKNRKQTFESKNYFKKVEELYWKNYSYDNKLILKFEIINLTAWKHDKSQQQPLRPGEAKFSLKDALK